MRALTRRTGPFPLLAALLCAVLLSLGGAPVAVAHAALVSSTPADGATVPALPAAATLTFNEDVNGDFAQVVAQGAGEPQTLTASVTGPTVTAPLPADLGTGRIAVRYRVVSKDGHPISGEITFTVAGPGGSVGSAGTAGSATSSGATSGGTSNAAAAPTTPPRPTGTASWSSGSTNSSDNMVMILLTGAGAAAMLGVALLLWRWERQRNKTNSWRP